MHRFEQAIRYLLALALLLFGADKFLHFLPKPEAPPAGAAFLQALADSSYLLPTVGIIYLLSALCFLSRRVVLGVVLLAPVLVNILGYHWKYDLPGIGGGAVLTALTLLVFLLNAGRFSVLFCSGRPD